MTVRLMLVLCTFIAVSRAATVEIVTEYPIIHSSTESPPSPSENVSSSDPLVVEEFPTVKPLALRREGGINIFELSPEHRQSDSGPDVSDGAASSTSKPDDQPVSSSTAPKPSDPTVPLEVENEAVVPSEEIPDKEAELEKELQKVNVLINEYLTEVLGKLGPIMKTGDPNLPMPVLDPLPLEDRDLSPIIGHEVFDVKMKKIKFSGISDFKITNIESHIRDMRVKISLHLPVVLGQSDFSANGTIFEVFRVSGEGNASLCFRNVYARTTLYLNLEDGKLRVDSADQPYVDFQDADVKFLNVDRKAKAMQQYGVYGQIAPILFWMFSGDIVDEMDDHLSVYLNDAFQKFETPKVLNEANLNIRLLRVHVPRKPWPYAYINPSYFHAVQRFN